MLAEARVTICTMQLHEVLLVLLEHPLLVVQRGSASFTSALSVIDLLTACVTADILPSFLAEEVVGGIGGVGGVRQAELVRP